MDYFQKRLDDKHTIEWVPSLNSTPLHQLKPNCLVRFRCMVQDTYDPEFYLGVYEVQDKNTGTKVNIYINLMLFLKVYSGGKGMTESDSAVCDTLDSFKIVALSVILWIASKLLYKSLNSAFIVILLQHSCITDVHVSILAYLS